MRGDRVEIVVEAGEGGVRDFEVVATKAGRRVEVTMARNTVEVSEVTRTGQTVRSARFMASRVVALVEHPAGDDGEGEPGSPGGQGAGGSRRRPPAGQPSLDL